MPTLRPEEFDLSALPRGPLGHVKPDAVADLLRRAAWDYREVLAENRRLAGTVQELTQRGEELTQRVEELTAQMASLEEAAVRHKDPDELARTFLTSARRAAREERESARLEAKLVLKKAVRRAEQLEEDVRRRTEAHRSELTRVEALREELIARLRATLEEIAGPHGAGANGVGSSEAAVRARMEQ